MPAINQEILIGGQNDGICKGLGHANEAGIRKAHGNLGIFFHQLRDCLEILSKLEGHKEGAPAQERAETRSSARFEKVVGLGQNCFAGQPGGRQIRSLQGSPCMVCVALAKKRHQKASVNENVSGHIL